MKRSIVAYLIIVVLILSGCSQSNYYTSREELTLKDDQVGDKIDSEVKDQEIRLQEDPEEKLEEQIAQVEEGEVKKEISEVKGTYIDNSNEVKQVNEDNNNADIEVKDQTLVNLEEDNAQGNVADSEEAKDEEVTLMEKENDDDVFDDNAVEDVVNEEAGESSEDIVNEYREKYGDEVDDVDEATGEALLSKVDQDYLLGLYDNGLTEREEEEMITYLHNHLTDQEYETMKELINKYIHLLSEED
ncbi:hypothetical protein [Vallitalea okinawensis]|uniref:hypothetical protein n=1 Tax=Vallitalea okinawensis TaxID=2078660 RepID=UPI000CFD7419|nr:hypothetical protein [Vallitalea okinawensis]